MFLDPQKKEFNIMSVFFSNILSSFSPLRCNHMESGSTSGGEDVSGENVVAVPGGSNGNNSGGR